ncbi:solute carrier family 15 member 1-like [Ptychodera flava]|uniref:solute carrier family 15 member 1-like n=1 Tax=Ptychodera flava TaxID=63121 RepID=UPI00396A992C
MGKKGSAEFGDQSDIPMEPTYAQDNPPAGDEKPKVEVDEYDPDAPCTERYPAATYFIIGMEFCERYCYYGMRTILMLYFTEILMMSDSSATSLYHTFAMLCYLTPIAGAMISDGFWGKYKTIFWISWIYLAGCAVMSFSAIPAIQSDNPNMGGTIVGLLLIAMGTGGIKPCVAAFGGDQFRKEQTREIQTYFLMFYLSINLGSLLSTFLTPILREWQCFDNDCYPLAFGIPAALLLVAIVIFVLGRYTVGYKIYPGEGNVVWMVCKCIGRAIKNKWRYRKDEQKKEKISHWLDYALDKYEKRMVNDTKCLLHVLVMFIPLPVFWALFDQIGSRWTLQATQMNGDLGNVNIKPDQMQVLNPLFIVILIPIFDNCVYPLLKKCGIRCTFLQRMCWGMLFSAASFYCACILQLFVSETVRVPPCTSNNDESGITIINAANCNITVKETLTMGETDPVDVDIPYGQIEEYKILNPAEYKYEYKCSNDEVWAGELNVALENCQEYRLIVGTFPSTNETVKLDAAVVDDRHDKPDRGTAYSSLVFTKEFDSSYILVRMNGSDYQYIVNATQTPQTQGSDIITQFRITEWDQFEPDEYTFEISQDYGETWEPWSAEEILDYNNGAAYSVVWYSNEGAEAFEKSDFTMTQHETVPANTINILWQIPQYFIITTGEVMFSITGLEFSYAQSPASMKSSLQACWLLTVAFGNLIVIIQSAAAPPRSMAIDFFLFGTLMLIVFFIYVAMSVWYTYIEPTHFDDLGKEEEEEGDEEKKPIPNGDGIEGKTNEVDTTEGEH